MKRPSHLGTPMFIGVAILLAATDDLHLNGCVPYHGDKAAGIREMTT